MAEGDDVSDNFAHTDYQIAALKNKWGNKSKDTNKEKKVFGGHGGGCRGPPRAFGLLLVSTKIGDKGKAGLFGIPAADTIISYNDTTSAYSSSFNLLTVSHFPPLVLWRACFKTSVP